jgi:hypothetical protein
LFYFDSFCFVDSVLFLDSKDGQKKISQIGCEKGSGYPVKTGP